MVHNLCRLWINHYVWSLCGGGNFRRENQPGFYWLKRKTQSFPHQRRSLDRRQRSPGLARGGEIDCFHSFGDEPNERSGCSATFFNVILQIFDGVLFSVFSAVNCFTGTCKAPKWEKYIEWSRQHSRAPTFKRNWTLCDRSHRNFNPL